MKIQLALAAVSMRSALKYRRNWNKNGPTAQLLRKFMPAGSTGYRLYIPIGNTSKHVVPPVTVRNAVRKAGYVITDYAAKKCVKRGDKEQKNVYNIGKVIAKDSIAKGVFDNDPQLQNSKTSEFTMVVSCHPYDIIGMSTGRDWDQTSCMRLSDNREGVIDGMNKHYLNYDVAEGTLVVYAVRSDDTNIKHPLGRCLLKPFIRDEDDGDEENPAIKYRRETRIYGNPVPGFAETMSRFIRKLNQGIPSGIYKLNEKLYNDGVGQADFHNSNDGTDVNWAVVDDAATLRENPSLITSFTAYIAERMKKNDESYWYIPLRTISEVAADAQVPARYMKQAARVLVQSYPHYIKATVADILENDNYMPEFILRFMLNKDFRKIVYDEGDRQYMAMHEELATYVDQNLFKFAQLSPIAAQRDVRARVRRGESHTVAFQFISGERAVPKNLIMKLPELHKYVRLYAELVRDSAQFGEDRFLNQAEGILAQLPEIDLSLTQREFYAFTEELYGMDYTGVQYLAFCYALRQIDAGDTLNAEIIFDQMLPLLWNPIIFNRRARKRLQKVSSESIQKEFKKRVSGLIRGRKRPLGEHRELISYLRENGMAFDTRVEWYNTAGSANEDYFPYLWFTEDCTDVELANSLVGGYEDFSAKVRPLPIFTARNEQQKRIFDMLFTYMTLTGQNPKPFGEFVEDYIDTFEEIDLSSDHPIDLVKYPQLLNLHNAKVMTFDSFIGSDNGRSFIKTMCERMTVGDTVRAITVIKERAADPARMVNAFDPTQDVNSMSYFDYPEKLKTKERLVEFMTFLQGFANRAREFATSLPAAVDDTEFMQQVYDLFNGKYSIESLGPYLDALRVMTGTTPGEINTYNDEVRASLNILMRRATNVMGDL